MSFAKAVATEAFKATTPPHQDHPDNISHLLYHSHGPLGTIVDGLAFSATIFTVLYTYAHQTSNQFYFHRIIIFHSSTFACHQVFLGARSISAIRLS